MKLLINIFTLLFVVTNVTGQEYLNGLPGNPELKGAKQSTVLKSAKATGLPFIDDFADFNPYPNPNNWTNNYVYINYQYAKGPVSIGVATFDAVNAKGEHYSWASSTPFIADTLTSRTINLENVNPTNLYLSFYYQPQGLGEQPEANDSLILQFLADDTTWHTVWFANGKSFENFRANDLGLDIEYTIDTVEFKFVTINITQPEYLHANFKMRFYNYASLNSLGDPSDATNCDHWNLDYVYLDQNRTNPNKLLNDVGMIEPPNSFLNVYSSVPWSHYNENENNRFRDVYIHVRNNDNEKRTLNQIKLYFENLETNIVDSTGVGSMVDIEPYKNTGSSKYFANSPIVWDASKPSAHYLMRAGFTTDLLDYNPNNTAYRTLTFEDYYSYDDGTAENSYGISTPDANVAQIYTTYKPDSLKAIQMYFLRNNPQTAAADGFKLCVWANNNGKPGTLLVERKGKIPEFADEMNQMVTYPLDTAIFIKDVFFIGWTQTTALRMNVGFNANNPESNPIEFYDDFAQINKKLFYNAYGSWVNSSFKGTLMIRPVFGSTVATGLLPEELKLETGIYPNPANTLLYFTNNQYNAVKAYTIYNLQGKVLLSAPANNEPVNLEALPVGVYIITLMTHDGGHHSHKLFIAR